MLMTHKENRDVNVI